MYLADTNIISELMRSRVNEGVRQWSAVLDGRGLALMVSAITVDEIIFGLHWRPNSAKMTWFDQFLLFNTVLPVTDAIARQCQRYLADQLLTVRNGTRRAGLVRQNGREQDGFTRPGR